MAPQWPPWLDKEEMLKRSFAFPTKEVLIPALKVGAGTGKDCIHKWFLNLQFPCRLGCLYVPNNPEII